MAYLQNSLLPSLFTAKMLGIPYTPMIMNMQWGISISLSIYVPKTINHSKDPQSRVRKKK